MSPGVYLMLRRLLRHHQPGDFERSDVEQLLNSVEAATDHDDDEGAGNAARMDLQEKRADARRCFYHAVNCWWPTPASFVHEGYVWTQEHSNLSILVYTVR